MLAILHITDLHFGKRAEEIFRNKRDLAESIVRALEREVPHDATKRLVVSGDLVFKGRESVNAYTEAKMFIEDLCREWQVDPTTTIICPGNHDIVKGESDPFNPINGVIFGVTQRSGLLFKGQTSVVLKTPEADFLVMNSAYRGNHEYGSVDLPNLATFPDSGKPRIAVVHHNLLGVFEADSSAIRNAYPLLVRLLHDKVRVVIHGHQHMLEEFPIGSPPCRIVGAGSLNFRNDSMPNQFNLLVLHGDSIDVSRFVWMADGRSDGRVGAWKRI